MHYFCTRFREVSATIKCSKKNLRKSLAVREKVLTFAPQNNRRAPEGDVGTKEERSLKVLAIDEKERDKEA